MKITLKDSLSAPLEYPTANEIMESNKGVHVKAYPNVTLAIIPWEAIARAELVPEK